jgi:hypothetical protein
MEGGMITEVQSALSWRKEATRQLVNFAALGTQVRPEGPVHPRRGTTAELPGQAHIREHYPLIIKRLSPGSGRPLETFLAVDNGPGMYIAEEAWTIPPPSR